MNINGLLDKLAADIPGGLVTIAVRGDKCFQIIYANVGFYELTGYTQESWIKKHGDRMDIIIPPADLDMMYQKIMDIKIAAQKVKLEFRILNREGILIWLALTAKVISIEEDETRILEAGILDITKQKEVEEELYIQNERYRIVEAISNDIICEYDLKNDILILPDKYTEKLGGNGKVENFSKKLSHSMYLYPGDYHIVLKEIEKNREQGEMITLQFRMNLFSEEYRWYEGMFIAICNENQELVRLLGKLKDIEEEKKKYYELQKNARLDPLTGLYNKMAIQEMVDNYLLNDDTNQEQALMIVDIDNFKAVNDTMGHVFGDNVIKLVADGLRECIGKRGWVGRIGGDEFLILVKNKTKEEVKEIAQKVTHIFYGIYTGEESVHISGSTGIAIYPKDGKTYEELLKKADKAMYIIKNSGKNWFHFYDDATENKFLAEKGEDKKEQKKMERNIARRASYLYNREIISNVFDVLSSTKNFSGGLNILLDRVGKAYNLDRIQVLQANHTNLMLEVKYLWKRHIVVVDSHHEIRSYFSSWEEFEAGFETDGMIVIEDEKQEVLNNGIKKIIEEMNIKAFIACGIYDDLENLLGCILYENNQREHKWSMEEKDTFWEVTKIISYFLLSHALRQRNSEKIEQLSNYDRITGLHQYPQFQQELEHILKTDTIGRMAIVNSDIKNFKYINDTYGLEAGDKILKAFAQTFITNNQYCIAGCRIYADNFIYIVRMNAKETLEKTILERNAEFEREQEKLYPSSNFIIQTGIYIISDYSMNPTQILDCAGLAKKYIKEHNQIRCTFYDETMKDRVLREGRVLAQIKDALLEKKIIPFLQPRFSLVTSEVIGAEALVRWKQNQTEYYYPTDFIPVLEKSGDIIELDFCIYQQVLELLHHWMEEDRKIMPLSVNFSRIHSHTQDCESKIIKFADNWKIPYELIEIEVTESVFLENTEVLQKKLRTLQEAGFKISIDDFGSGYSSLGIISKFPIDIIKLDQSFLKDISFSEQNASVIRAIAKMAKDMNIQFVCEGVETPEQVSFLLQCGCTMGQGFVFAKPMPIKEFEQKYRKN